MLWKLHLSQIIHLYWCVYPKKNSSGQKAWTVFQWARDHKRHSSHEKQDDTSDILLSGTVHVLLATGTYKQLDYSILVDKNLSKDPIFAIYMYNVYTKSLKNKIPPS